jgi:hypothetical protein
MAYQGACRGAKDERRSLARGQSRTRAVRRLRGTLELAEEQLGPGADDPRICPFGGRDAVLEIESRFGKVQLAGHPVAADLGCSGGVVGRAQQVWLADLLGGGDGPFCPGGVTSELGLVTEVVDHLAERKRNLAVELGKVGAGALEQLLDAGEATVRLGFRQAMANRSGPARSHRHRLAERPKLLVGPQTVLQPELPGPLEGLGTLVATAPDLPESLVQVRLRCDRRELDGGIEVSGRLGGGSARGGRLGGAAQPLHGQPREVLGHRLGDQAAQRDRLAQVERDQLRQLVLAPGGRRPIDQPPAGGAVQARALRAGQRVVRDLADEDVPERDRTEGRRPNQVPVEEVLDGSVDRFGLELRVDRRDRPGLEGSPEDGAELDDAPSDGGQRVEPGEDGGVDRVGERRDGTGHRCGIGRWAKAIDERAHDLAGIEGVAFGPSHDRVDDLGRWGFEEVLDERGDRG